MTENMPDEQVVVIGAGPAGLTSAYELTKHGLRPIVLERESSVGGISCTKEYRGYRFDMGGHRFFTKVDEVNSMWREILGHDLLRRPRLSRIYYDRKLFDYPLRPLNALRGLGVWQGIRIILSYLRWHIRPYSREDTFEQWTTNRFGKRLFEIFFKAYTEKVWGIPCSELRAEWAAQRIKDLSLRTALLSMFLRPTQTISTLIHEFDYPRLGPGMFWQAVKERIEARGGAVRMQSEVMSIHRDEHRVDSVTVACNGHREEIRGTSFVSSMPVSELVQILDPPAPVEVVEAARKLRHRDFLTVCLVVGRPDLFPDNWIYVHAPDVQVGRIQNFGNWSPHMVPDPTKASLGLEYFCTEGDALWTLSDAELIELGTQELEHLGLATRANVEDGCVFRVPKAYPVYDANYRDHLTTVRDFLGRLENLQTIGRNGLHRYNNQDHAMLTGMLASRNLVLGEENDLWSVNVERSYHEEVQPIAGAETPEVTAVLEETLKQILSKLDPVALGLATGLTTGMLLFLATLLLVFKGGAVVGPRLALLRQYFPGYSVTLLGSVVGLTYGGAVGYVMGFGAAFLRNLMVVLYMLMIRRQAESRLLQHMLEYL